MRLLHGLCHGATDKFFASRHRTETHVEAEQILHHGFHQSLAQATGTREEADDGLDTGAKTPRRDSTGQLGTSDVPAVLAGRVEAPVLGRERLDRRDLPDLMAIRIVGVDHQMFATAFFAARGDELFELVDFVRWHQRTLIRLVSRLSALFALAPFLLLLSRLLRSGRIARWGLV